MLELHRVAGGTTGHTTGKVTSQHGLTYAELVRQHGEDRARGYGQANEAGVALVASLTDELEIDCALTRAPAYVFTQQADQRAAVEEEARVAARLGLPAALADPAEVPLAGVLAAVRFDDQLHFDAAHYCQALAAAIVAGGGAVHERTRAEAVKEQDDGVVVRTPRGQVRAGHAVVATLLPFVDTGGFFAKARASRAYGLAATVADPERVGMFISAEQPTRSTRPWLRGDGQTGLIVVGEEHPTGGETETEQHYQALEDWARATFAVESIEYSWSAHDYTTVDHIPYVGRSPRRQRTWVATGFRKWGLSNGTAAGILLTELIEGRSHPWADVFDATRIGGRQAVTKLVTENAKVGAHLVGDWLGRLKARPVERLGLGEGGVVRRDGKVFGAYRYPDGATTASASRAPTSAARCGGTRPRRAGTARATARGSATTAPSCRGRR